MHFKIAVISSVPPDPNLVAGALILSRWLDHPRIDWTYIAPLDKPKRLPWKILDRLTRTRFHKIAGPLKKFYETNELTLYVEHQAFFRYAKNRLAELDPDIILSVAHGPFYKIAHRASGLSDIPLLLLAQDWYPDFVKGALKRRREKKDFIRICNDSAATIAVSEGMYRALGQPKNGLVLHDLPSDLKGKVSQANQPTDGALKVIYAGNISTYGPMVEQAARACMESRSVRMEIYGRKPIRWSEGTEDEFREAGIYRGFVSPDDFPGVAKDYDFVLAIQSFAPELRQRMKTCFLSKIVELAQIGKPIVIWGPEDGSAAVWGKSSGAALCITDPSPQALRKALEALAADPREQLRLVEGIRKSAENEFNPIKIRNRFMDVLGGLSKTQRRVFAQACGKVGDPPQAQETTKNLNFKDC